MSDHTHAEPTAQGAPPGVSRARGSLLSYLAGLGFAIVLTLASFWTAGTDMVKQGLASAASRIPLGRFGTPEECAQIVLMLAGNAYMTGQTVALSGGMSFL